MRRYFVCLPLILLAMLISLGFRPPTITMALITKIVQEVTKKSPATEWEKASKGETLTSGDYLRTGKKSLAIVKFTDNSMLRVRELSEMRILGEIRGTALSKTVDIQTGGFGFDIRKQQDEEFIFTSPTSVASIRGTKGKMTTGSEGDTMIVTEGTINLTNNASQRNVTLPAGTIGFSNPDGSISSRKATDRELAGANEAISGGGSQHELKLDLRDPQGNKRELRIHYKK